MERVKYLIFILLVSCASNSFKSTGSLDTYKKIKLPSSLYRFSLYNQESDQNKQVSSILQCLKNGKSDYYNSLLEEYKKDNKNLTANLKLADCEAVNGSFGRAFFYYDRSLGLTKNKSIKSIVYNNLAIVFAKKGFDSYSDYYFGLAFQNDRDSELITYNQMILRMRAGKYLEAGELVNKRLRKLSDKNYWTQLVGVNYFLQGDLDQSIIKLIKGNNEESSEMGLLKLASSLATWSQKPELVKTNLEAIEQLQFSDPLWIEVKSILLSRVKQTVASNEKN